MLPRFAGGAAQLLHLSIKTIESHRQRIKRKLNLTTGVS
jgi:DNA-binding CsgD family transcriptional regulator